MAVRRAATGPKPAKPAETERAFKALMKSDPRRRMCGPMTRRPGRIASPTSSAMLRSTRSIRSLPGSVSLAQG